MHCPGLHTDLWKGCGYEVSGRERNAGSEAFGGLLAVLA
jgi:hypothetical protein